MPKEVSQHQKFIDAAKELSCNDDPKAFDKALREIASAPPDKAPAKKKKSNKPAE